MDTSVVAIHGIGVDADDTWETNGVNWLKHSEMLPDAAPTARIMRFGWESKWISRDSTISAAQQWQTNFLTLCVPYGWYWMSNFLHYQLFVNFALQEAPQRAIVSIVTVSVVSHAPPPLPRQRSSIR